MEGTPIDLRDSDPAQGISTTATADVGVA